MRDVDYIIVGQGLAGTCLAWELRALGASCIVIDREAAVTSSRIAAGLITPVTGQRLVKTWRFDELRPAAWEFYRRVERELGCQLLRDTLMMKVFATEQEREFFGKRQRDPAYDGLLREWADLPAGVLAPLGGCEVLRGAQLDASMFLTRTREMLTREGAYLAGEIALPEDVQLMGQGQACFAIRSEVCSLSPTRDAVFSRDETVGERAGVRGQTSQIPPHPGPLPHNPPQIENDVDGEREGTGSGLPAAQLELRPSGDSHGVEVPRFGLRAKTLVFCEGISSHSNPWFSNVEFNPARGEMLTVRIPDWTEDRVIHSGVWIAPLGATRDGDRLYRVGATYDWAHLDSGPTAEGRSLLITALEKLISVPYEIVDHVTAVRPILKQLNPVIGRHPHNPQLGYFNGLASKGSLQAPFFARQFASHLVNQTPIERVVDLQVRVPWPR